MSISRVISVGSLIATIGSTSLADTPSVAPMFRIIPALSTDQPALIPDLPGPYAVGEVIVSGSSLALPLTVLMQAAPGQPWLNITGIVSLESSTGLRFVHGGLVVADDGSFVGDAAEVILPNGDRVEILFEWTADQESEIGLVAAGASQQVFCAVSGGGGVYSTDLAALESHIECTTVISPIAVGDGEGAETPRQEAIIEAVQRLGQAIDNPDLADMLSDIVRNTNVLGDGDVRGVLHRRR